MACKLDVDIVIKQVVERNVKNIYTIKDNFADTTVNFGKEDIQAIGNLNKQWGEKVITYNSPEYNDVPGNITISISEKLYDKYIKAIDKKRNVENTEKIREELRKDAERAGVEYTDDYLFQKQTQSQEGIIASEKTIRDLAAKIADRIGMKVVFESDRSKDYKGKIENNVVYVNLAYATLDTPIHEILGHPIIRALKTGTTQNKTLYQNLLKELETGRGKEVLDRIKRDYVYKHKEPTQQEIEIATKIAETFKKLGKPLDESTDRILNRPKYTLEEQQEEAIVELLGLMTAEKLDKVKDGKLISLLKRLLKEMKQFVRSLINQKEVEIDKLPDNMTIEDIADLLAYSNSKLILPGYEVEYTTPDNQKFKTYQEASNHISELSKNVKDVDLDSIIREFPKKLQRLKEVEEQIKNEGIMPNSPLYNKLMSEVAPTKILLDFIEKNKEYEQSKEIIEEWKKVNNIQYNPEEIYSRGQEFSSVVGAYSNFDVNLMMQNLLSHIEDNEKAVGQFAISAYTKPIDKQIGHLEGGGGKIKFKLYPQSNDILWAANTDVYSGSVWDASEKVNKDKKSELLGVSYTKYPSLSNVNTVQPNLAAIVDDLQHHHNELAISLNFSNFELEVDDDVPYQTKKIIENVNKILQQKRLEEVNSIINKLEKEC